MTSFRHSLQFIISKERCWNFNATNDVKAGQVPINRAQTLSCLIQALFKYADGWIVKTN